MPEQDEAERFKTASEQKWTTYNSEMAKLFEERDRHPVDSPEREAAALQILALWVTDG